MDFISDINIDDVDGIHEGFYDQYVAVRDYIGRTNLRHDSLTLVACGQSLGGAIASIMRVKQSAICVTCGAPSAFRRGTYHDGLPAHTRIIDRSDIVPRVPGKTFGYRHHDARVIKIGWWNPFMPITRHFMSSYWKKLKKYVNTVK